MFVRVLQILLGVVHLPLFHVYYVTFLHPVEHVVATQLPHGRLHVRPVLEIVKHVLS